MRIIVNCTNSVVLNMWGFYGNIIIRIRNIKNKIGNL